MKKLLYLISFFYLNSIFSQIPVQTLDSRNGFLSNNIYDIEKDSKGFLWIITDKGVVRYNGKSYLLFNSNNGLKSDDYYKLIIDSHDNVWLYSNKEICKIDSNLIYKHITSTHNYFGRFLIDHKGRIHFSRKISDLKWDHYFIENDKVKKIDSKFDLGESIRLSKRYKLHGFSFLHKKQLYNYVYDSANKGFYSQEQFVNGKYIIQNKPILDLGLTANKNLKLYSLDDNYTLLTSIDQFKLFYKGLLIDYGFWPRNALKITTNNIAYTNKSILIPFDQGVFEFLILGNKLTYNKSILDLGNCTSIIKDIESNLWVSTLGSGVIRLSRYKLKKIDIQAPKDELIYLMNTNLAQHILGVTNKGIYNLENSRLKFQTKGLFEVKVLLNEGNNYFYAGNNAFYINNNIIFSSASVKDISIHENIIALCIFNGVLLKLKTELTIPKNKIGDILVDIPIKANCVQLSKDRIYIGTADGLIFFKLKGNFLVRDEFYKISLNGNSSIKSIKINHKF
ncbi:MAG: hypothetical protein LW630_05070 [Saprospiraceae bacterium]|nr:hypothetical protein [Saprospiraceae bacterium]